MSAAGNVEVVRALYAAFGKGDAAAIFATLDPAVVFEVHAPKTVPYGGAWSGLEGAKAFFGAIASSIDVLDFGADETFPSGDVVVAAGHETIRVKSTGNPLAHRWLHVFRLRDGKIVRFDEWFDSAAVTAAFLS
jgi:ketosteroid isomerase-like protein